MLKSLSVLSAACLCLAGPVAAQPVPTLTAARFATPPVIDGKLDDACWARAEPTGGFVSTNARASVKEQTSVRVGYDATHLYVGFECLESRMGEVRAEYQETGGSVWLDDAVELFVSPHATASRSDYVHFGVSIAGTRSAEEAAKGPAPLAWTARTSRGTDRWFVEIAIPFTTLGSIGANDDCWRVNFCRNEHPSGDSYTSWSPIEASFHDFWRFGRLVAEPGAPGFARSRGMLRPLPPAPAVPPREFAAAPPNAPEPETPIIPAPRQMKPLPGRFVITRATQIVVGDRVTPMDRRAAEEISQEVHKALGYRLEIVPAGRVAKGRPAILVGEPWRNARVKAFLRAAGQTVTVASPGREGYMVAATPRAVVVAGSDQAGTFWGAQTVRQMIRADGRGSGSIRCAAIRDWPRMAYRGVHLLTASDGLAFHGKCIEEVFSRYKISQIILEAQHVRWDSHPEVYNPARGMSKEDVRRLVSIARRHHITVTPLIQSLGHMEWAFFKGNHLDLAEDRNTPYALCPSNEAGYRFMFDIMDEATDLFGKPKYMHIGHDEITNFGRFPVDEACTRIGKHRLYVNDILRYYRHLKAKGVTPMIWGDVLTSEGYRDEIGRLPRDIVVCDWRYSALKDFATLDFYRKAGFPLIGCTWYLPGNLYYFSTAGARRGILGMCQTTWTGYLPSDKVLESEYYQIYSYIQGAEWAWSPGVRKPDHLGYDPESVLAEDLGVAFPVDPASRYAAVPLAAHATASRADREEAPGWIGIQPGEDASSLPAGSWTLKGVPYAIGPAAIVLRGGYPTRSLPEAVRGVAVGRTVTALHFLHATGWEAGPGQTVGRYVIHFTDGSSQAVSLRYGQEIRWWRDDLSSNQKQPIAWSGWTAARAPVALRTFTWTNPTPGKAVVSVDLESAGTDASPILVALTAQSPR